MAIYLGIALSAAMIFGYLVKEVSASVASDAYYERDVRALLAIKDAFPESSLFTSWLEGQYKTWEGVEWSNSTPKRVVGLRLVSQNEKLRGALDVSALSELVYLSCYGNKLTSLNVSGLKNLTYLNSSHNRLESLEIAYLPNLSELRISNNRLERFDASGLPSLTLLEINDNNLKELNVTGLSQLLRLSCARNQLTELDLFGLTSLRTLNCESNRLVSLDASQCVSLAFLNCRDNELTNLNVTGLTYLEALHCGNNLLTELDLSGTSIRFLDGTSNPLEILNISNHQTLPQHYPRSWRGLRVTLLLPENGSLTIISDISSWQQSLARIPDDNWCPRAGGSFHPTSLPISSKPSLKIVGMEPLILESTGKFGLNYFGGRYEILSAAIIPPDLFLRQLLGQGFYIDNSEHDGFTFNTAMKVRLVSGDNEVSQPSSEAATDRVPDYIRPLIGGRSHLSPSLFNVMVGPSHNTLVPYHGEWPLNIGIDEFYIRLELIPERRLGNLRFSFMRYYKVVP